MEQITAKNINLVTVGEKNSHPKNIHPDLISPLSEFIKNIEYLGPVRQACPLSKFILRERLPGLTDTHAHTHTQDGEKGTRGILWWFSLCPKIRPSPQRLVAGSFDAETAALTYQRRGMRRVKDEKSGAWHGPASALFSLERVRRLRRRWIRGYKAEAAVNH